MSSEWVEAVREAQAGREQAFGQIVTLVWADLVRLARSMVGEVEAEDAVQDSLVVAWRSIHQLRDPACLKAWLARIVFRRCLWRARWRRLRVAMHVAPEPRHEPDPVSTLSLEELMSRLAPQQRAVLHMSVVEGMSDSEVGSALGLSAGTVRAHRRRARARIGRILSEGKR